MSLGMPRPPSNLSELSTEDLRRIEGQERENVEARIQWLRDIQALMDGAMVMINQYNTVAAQLRYGGQLSDDTVIQLLCASGFIHRLADEE